MKRRLWQLLVLGALSVPMTMMAADLAKDKWDQFFKSLQDSEEAGTIEPVKRLFESGVITINDRNMEAEQEIKKNEKAAEVEKFIPTTPLKLVQVILVKRMKPALTQLIKDENEADPKYKNGISREVQQQRKHIKAAEEVIAYLQSLESSHKKGAAPRGAAPMPTTAAPKKMAAAKKKAGARPARAAKRAPAKRPAARKTSARKAAAKRPVTRRAPKKAARKAARKTPARRTLTPKKAAAKKAAARKGAAKKGGHRHAAAKKKKAAARPKLTPDKKKKLAVTGARAHVTQEALYDQLRAGRATFVPTSAMRITFYAKDRPFYEFANFYPARFVDTDGNEWPTSEHYFQAHKFAPTSSQWKQISNARTAREAFDIARNSIIADMGRWNAIKDGFMRDALYYKFSQNADLRHFLLGTGDATLIEASDVDPYWGWGAGPDHKGKNMLGKLLMELRDELRKEEGKKSHKARH